MYERWVERVVSKSKQNARFSNAAVADQQKFKKQVKFAFRHDNLVSSLKLKRRENLDR